MKYLIYTILLFIFPAYVFCQDQDSVVYIKKLNDWYKVTHTVNEEIRKVSTSEVYFTNSDSLIKSNITEDIRLAALKLWDIEKTYKAERKAVIIKITTGERQYTELFTGRPDLDGLSNAKQLLGNWTLGGTPYTITNSLSIGSSKIRMLCDKVFAVRINSVRHYFVKISNNKWVNQTLELIRQ